MSRRARVLNRPIGTALLAALPLLASLPARADVAAAENRLNAACLTAWKGDTTACACLIAGLRRAIPSGDYEMSLDMALVGLRMGRADARAPMPASLRNRYRLTPDAAAAAQARLGTVLQQAQQHCVPR